jgi:hypothetical protein
MAQVLEIAPRLKPGTQVILINVPKDNDPFLEDNMWFDMALHLAYPGTRVSGKYVYDDDAAEARGPSTMLLAYQKDGRIAIVEGQERIDPGAPSPLAMRRYGK